MFDQELLGAFHDAILRFQQFALASPPPGLASPPPSLQLAITAVAGVAVVAAVGGTLLYNRRSHHKRRRKKHFPLTQEQWWDAFDTEDGRLTESYELLKRIRFGGIEPSIRAEVWPFILGFHDLKSTRAEREKEKAHKRKEYQDLRRQCNILRERSNEGCFEGEIGPGAPNSSSEEVEMEAARDFTAASQTAMDSGALGLGNNWQDTKVDCSKESLSKVQDGRMKDSCLSDVENVSIHGTACKDGAYSGPDSSRGNAEGNSDEEPLKNASANERGLHSIEEVTAHEKASEDAYVLERKHSRENTGGDCKEKRLKKYQVSGEVWEDISTSVNGTEDDTSSGADSSQAKTEEDYRKEFPSTTESASIEDSSTGATDLVSTIGMAMENDNSLKLDNSKEKTEEDRNNGQLSKAVDASILERGHMLGKEVTPTDVKATDDGATSTQVSSVNLEEKPLNNVHGASMKDGCLKVTEDVIQWQRIIRLDAVRMNAEWVPYSPTQASVTETVAQELATSVGLKDDEHLEPCRQHHAARLVAILEAYALYDPETGYCQGMSDLLSPFVALLDDDYEAFWCFAHFMNTTRYNFRKDEIGIRRQLDLVSRILKAGDPRLYYTLEITDAQDCFFVYRMVLVLMRRELSFEQTISLWEVLWAELRAVKTGDASFSKRKSRREAAPTSDLLLYVIAAAVQQRRDVIIKSCTGMDEVLRECNSMAGNLDVWALLDDARDLVYTVQGRISK